MYVNHLRLAVALTVLCGWYNHANATSHPLDIDNTATSTATSTKPTARDSGATNHQTQIAGHVDLVAAPGQSLALGEVVDTLVYFVPKSGKIRVHPGTYTIYTVNMDFRPAAMAVPIGSKVKFTNLDQVLHNLYSATPESTFDFQFQASGQSIAHAFTHAGPVLISCNVHRSMELDLLVVPTPYMTAVSADGHFVLHGLPRGPGTLYFWNPRASLATQPVTVFTNDVDQQLTAIKPRTATELNLGDKR